MELWLTVCFSPHVLKTDVLDCFWYFGLILTTTKENKAGHTATPVAWAGAIIEVSGTFGQEH